MVYWGESRLRKICGMLGEVLRFDNASLNFDKLMFARLVIDMRIDSEFHEAVYFTDVMDNLIQVKVLYDWKPIVCTSCKVGLQPAIAEVPIQVVEVNVPAQGTVQEPPNVLVTSNRPIDKAEGCQMGRGRSR